MRGTNPGLRPRMQISSRPKPWMPGREAEGQLGSGTLSLMQCLGGLTPRKDQVHPVPDAVPVTCVSGRSSMMSYWEQRDNVDAGLALSMVPEPHVGSRSVSQDWIQR